MSADLLTRAAAVLRCEHWYSLKPLHTLDRPGNCALCAVPYDRSVGIPEALRAALAVWLEDVASEVAEVPRHARSEIEKRSRHAVAVARAVLREDAE